MAIPKNRQTSGIRIPNVSKPESQQVNGRNRRGRTSPGRNSDFVQRRSDEVARNPTGGNAIRRRGCAGGVSGKDQLPRKGARAYGGDLAVAESDRADDFCLKQFHATEAAFRSILVLFNLLAEFQRATGSAEYRRPSTLRAHVFVRGAVLGRCDHWLVLPIANSWGGLPPRKPLIESIFHWPILTSPKLDFVMRT